MPRFLPRFWSVLLLLPLIVSVALLIPRWLPREYKLATYQLLLNQLAWLVVPYIALALYCAWRAFAAKHWARLLLAISITLGAVTAGYARFVEPAQLQVREATIVVGANARIALISDLHIGLYQGRDRTEQIVDKLNTLDVDAVLVAGDWTYEPTRPLAELLAPFARCRHRVLSVPGNHDEELPGPPLAAELRAALIANRIEPIEGLSVQVKNLHIVGMGDRSARKDALVPSTVTERGPVTIALAHNPDSVDRLVGTHVKLLLAGHTHGGQINIPYVTEAVLGKHTRGDFKRGLYQRGDQQVYVTAGLGMTGAPLRFNQVPTIDVLNLR